MREETEIKREELQEMAKTILCEIYGAAKARSTSAGSDFSETGGVSDFGFTRGTEGLEKLFPAYADLGDMKRTYAEKASSEELYPRLKRGEFWEQRLLRRKTRENQRNTGGEAAAETVRNTQMRPGKLSGADLPEQLSDIFCRDARRYDGAFERY